MKKINRKLDRYLGCLLGLACGDALGTTVEFRNPGTFEPVTDITGGGPFRLNPGEWTDDTSMALCLAESLIECRHFNPEDQMKRYVKWMEEGYMSSNGICFDIGGTVQDALHKYMDTGEPFSGSTDPYSAGNGCIMRLAPVPMAFAGDIKKAVFYCGESSRTTHGAQTCIDACKYFGSLIVKALQGKPELEIFNPPEKLTGLWKDDPLCGEIDEISQGLYPGKQPPDIAGTGYVVKSLEAALWSIRKTDNFRDACLKAVNLGDDADTTGAVCGQLAGAIYGKSGMPREWLDRIVKKDLIEHLAEDLYLSHRDMKRE